MTLCNNFKGLCTYPIGGYLSIVLFITSCIALSTTIYGTVSCTFASITFTSTSGNFEEYFTTNYYNMNENNNNNDNNTTDTTTATTFTASVGLFQYLRPPGTSAYVNDIVTGSGSCVGYQQSMLQYIASTNRNDESNSSDSSSIFFEVSRTMGIISVLLGILLSFWSITSSCMEYNRFQVTLLCFLSFMGWICTMGTFFFYYSPLCQNIFLTTSCQMNNGGLVMISAIMSWFMCFILCYVYVLPTTRQNNNNNIPMTRSRGIMTKTKNNQIRNATTTNNNRGNNNNYDDEAEKVKVQELMEKALRRMNRTFQKKEKDEKKIQTTTTTLPTQPPITTNAKLSNITTNTNTTTTTTTPPVKKRSSLTSATSSGTNGGKKEIIQQLQSIPTIQQQQQQVGNESSRIHKSHSFDDRVVIQKGGILGTNNNNNNNNNNRMVVDDVSEADTMEVYIQQQKQLKQLQQQKSPYNMGKTMEV